MSVWPIAPARWSATGSSPPSVGRRHHGCRQRRRVDRIRDQDASPGRDLDGAAGPPEPLCAPAAAAANRDPIGVDVMSARNLANTCRGRQTVLHDLKLLGGSPPASPLRTG